jgi:hypothetical protein
VGRLLLPPPKTLITPALFSHRTPPNREKREKSKNAPIGFPSPGRWEGVGEGTGVRDLGGGRYAPADAPSTRFFARFATIPTIPMSPMDLPMESSRPKTL